MRSLELQRKSGCSLHQQLVCGLRRYIEHRLPGTPLPSETAFCRQYGLARMTVSKALNELEAMGLVERRKGSGTYVSSEPSLVFLLPYAEALTDKSFINDQLRTYFSGIMKAAHDFHIRVETLAVSLTNNPEDIEFVFFRHINSSSWVFVTPWFYKVFELLAERRARVCLLHSQSLAILPPPSRAVIEHWCLQEMDRQNGVERLIRFWLLQGCRRIALLVPYILSENNHPVLMTYRRLMREADLPELYQELSETENQAEQVAALYKRDAFDALLTANCFEIAAGDPKAYLHLPSSVRLGFAGGNADVLPASVDFSYYSFPFAQIGYEAVQMLASAKSSCRIYTPRLLLEA
ncbi:MAG: GntR family transcriptional regulator [Lentisphaeria bacterium]